eukprot:gene4900-5543_t
MKYFYVNTAFDVIKLEENIEYSKVESKKRPFNAIEKELVNVSKRSKVDEATQQNNEIEVKETLRDPRKKPLDLLRCKLKTLSNNCKIKTNAVKPIARVASKTIANNAPESKADPNSFVAEETNITNRKVDNENAVANLFDDMLLPLIDEPHSPPARVFADFDPAGIVFPNEANEGEVQGSATYIRATYIRHTLLAPPNELRELKNDIQEIKRHCLQLRISELQDFRNLDRVAVITLEEVIIILLVLAIPPKTMVEITEANPYAFTVAKQVTLPDHVYLIIDVRHQDNTTLTETIKGPITI